MPKENQQTQASNGRSQINGMPKKRAKNMRIVQYSPDVSVDPLILPPEVVTAIDNVGWAREDRRRLEVVAKLELVHDRVKQALQNVGLAPSVDCSPSEIDAVSTAAAAQIPLFDPRKKRLELSRQRDLLEMVKNFMESSQSRQLILTDLSDWLESANDLVTDCPTLEEFEQREAEHKLVCTHVEEALDYASDVAEQIKSMGMELLREAGYLDSDQEEEESTQPRVPLPARKDAKDILDEATLLADPEAFQSALKDIKILLEQSVRMVRQNQEKQVVRQGLKQYKNIVKAAVIQQETLQQRDELICQQNEEIENLKTSNKQTKTEFEKADSKAQNLDKKLGKVQAQNKDLKVCNVNLLREIEDMKELHEAREEELLRRKLSVVTFSSDTLVKRASFGSKSLLKATESAIGAATKQLQDELDQYKQETEDQRKLMLSLEKQLNTEKESKLKLEAKMQVSDNMLSGKSSFDSKMKEEMRATLNNLQTERDSLHVQLSQTRADLASKQELIDFQESRIEDMKKEMGIVDVEDFLKDTSGPGADVDVKRMVHRMKKDFELENNRMKKHIEKEKLRHEAVLRKQDQAHKDQLSSTYKQSLHLVRAINRFKVVTSEMFEREGLPVAASDIKRIQSLPTEESPGDAKSLLSQMAGLAVELLVTMEYKLSQALMNIRLEMKDTSIAKIFASKDLEIQTEAAHKAKQASECLSEKLKEVQSKLTMAEGSLTFMRKMEDARNESITNRYRKLLSQYICVQKDMDKLQKEYRDTTRHKNRSLRRALANKHSIAKVVEEQQLIISKIEQHFKKSHEEKKRQLRLSIADQKHNLKLLEHAFKENRISVQTYSMTIELIHQSMELPQIKLRYLFERYIAHRKFNIVKEDLKEKATDRLLAGKRNQIQGYLTKADTRLQQATKQWHRKREELEVKRVQLFESMDTLFNDVIVESGILLIQPDTCLRAPPSEASIQTQQQSSDGATETTSGYCSGSVASSGKVLALTGAHMPTLPREIKGTGMPLQSLQQTLWELPTIPRLTAPPVIDVPRILDLEVNERMRAAKKALNRARFRQKFPVSNAEIFDYGHSEAVVPVGNAISHHGRRCYGRSFPASDTDSMCTGSSVQDQDCDGSVQSRTN